LKYFLQRLKYFLVPGLERNLVTILLQSKLALQKCWRNKARIKTKIYSLHEPDVHCISKGRNIQNISLAIKFLPRFHKLRAHL